MKRYEHYEIKGLKGIDPRSIKTKKIKDGTLIRIGCPEGYWDDKNKKCLVGTVAVSMLKKRKSNPLGASISSAVFKDVYIYPVGIMVAVAMLPYLLPYVEQFKNRRLLYAM